MAIPPGKPKSATAATMSKTSQRQDQSAAAPSDNDLKRPATAQKDTSMVNHLKDDQQKIRAGYSESSSDSVSTLVPMLLGGLVLIIIAMIVIIIFV